MNEKEFAESVRLLFGVGTTGRAILEELRSRNARPFAPDPYRTAYNLGAAELVNQLLEMADE